MEKYEYHQDLIFEGYLQTNKRPIQNVDPIEKNTAKNLIVRYSFYYTIFNISALLILNKILTGRLVSSTYHLLIDHNVMEQHDL